MNQFERNTWAIGQDGQNKLHKASILVIGVGGVGGAAIELLARAGVGSIDLVDHDTVDVTNINRQLIANHNTVGELKVDLWKKRILEINPNCRVNTKATRYDEDTSEEILSKNYTYIIDAFDQYKQKMHLAITCSKKNQRVIHSMGAANRFDPNKFKVSTLDKVEGDYIGSQMKRKFIEMKKNPKRVKVVYSTEQQIKQTPPASLSFTPMAAGNLLAHYVFNWIIKKAS